MQRIVEQLLNAVLGHVPGQERRFGLVIGDPIELGSGRNTAVPSP